VREIRHWHASISRFSIVFGGRTRYPAFFWKLLKGASEVPSFG
jgi:hypothetical protein